MSNSLEDDLLHNMRLSRTALAEQEKGMDLSVRPRFVFHFGIPHLIARFRESDDKQCLLSGETLRIR